MAISKEQFFARRTMPVTSSPRAALDEAGKTLLKEPERDSRPKEQNCGKGSEETVRGQFEDTGLHEAQGFQGASRTVRGQFEDSSETTETVRGHLEDSSKTLRGHLEDSSETVRGQVRGQVQRQVRGQFRDSSRTDEKATSLSFSALVRTRRAVVLFLFQKARTARGFSTSLILTEEACEALKLSTSNWKKTIQRLAQQGWFQIRGFNGAGGSIYTFTERAWVALLEHETEDKFEDSSETSSRTSSETSSRTNSPLSSSSYIETNFKPTTTADVESRARAISVWAPEELDYSMLTDIGFGRSQALQLRSLGLSFDIVQRSLVYFDFELRHTPSGKTIQEPLALLMKRLRQNGCWEAPEEYTKRLTHFRTRFDAREQQIDETQSHGEITGDQEGPGATPAAEVAGGVVAMEHRV